MSLPLAFRIHAVDTVATLIEDTPAGPVSCAGCPGLVALEPIARGHKIAVVEIPAGAAVLKYGSSIGTATCTIARGAWVHLHNLRSDYDERSGSLDLHSGAAKDNSSAYV